MRNEELFNRSIQDSAYDLLGQMLLEQKTERLLKEIEAEKAGGDTAEMDAFFARYDRHNLARIHAHCRRQKTKRLLLHTLPRIGRAAAVVIAVIALAGGAAIAASHTVRVQVMRLLVHMGEEYTELKLVEDEETSFDVPAEWQGSSYLSYIPDGLELVKVWGPEEMGFVEYADAQTGEIRLFFKELGSSAEGNIDTEDAELTEVFVRGMSGYMVVKKTTVSIFWTDGAHYFILTTKEMGREEALAIAESVRRIK